jgi:chemotaxis protein MotB
MEEAKTGEKSQMPAPRRHHKKHAGGHGGSWKVAYADFMTAMLALFIVLWVLNQSSDVKKAVESYFRDPVGFSKNSKSMGSVPITGTKGALTNFLPTSAEQLLEARSQREIQWFEMVIGSDNFLGSIEDKIGFEMTDEGLLIEIADDDTFRCFESGSMRLTPLMTEFIRVVTREIIKLNNPVVLAGHTDSQSFAGDLYSNWELSSDRANAVRRAMLSFGLPPSRISQVRAYANTRPRNTENSMAPENRRFGILLMH